MAEDETVEVATTEEVEPTESTETVETTEPQEPQEDYRGKLNATNGFLKKEGYVFDETKKQWAKPASAPQPEQKSSNGLSATDQKRLDRIELNSVGVKDREEQDFVLSAAKRLGVDPSTAAADSIVAAKLEQMRAVKASKDATPPPTRASGSSRSSKLPDFTKMSDAEFDKWRRTNP